MSNLKAEALLRAPESSRIFVRHFQYQEFLRATHCSDRSGGSLHRKRRPSAARSDRASMSLGTARSQIGRAPRPPTPNFDVVRAACLNLDRRRRLTRIRCRAAESWMYICFQSLALRNAEQQIRQQNLFLVA